MALYELRQYKIRDGKMADCLELSHSQIVPYGMSKGIAFVHGAVMKGSQRSAFDACNFMQSRLRVAK